MDGTSSDTRAVALRYALVLCLLTLGVFLQATGFDFITLDDPAYVVDNPYVRSGVTAEGLAWAFDGVHLLNWHPLTWVSLQIDATLFGPGPFGFHLTNVLLHLGSTLLLFGVFLRATGMPHRAAMVAALFAIHPLHVESVAWVSERKDVLSVFFATWSMYVYVRWTQDKRRCRYVAALVLFVMATMSKATVVTLPCVLLLLDWWPLDRLTDDAFPGARMRRLARLALEKAPFFAASLVCSVMALAGDATGSATYSDWTLLYRFETAVIAYGSYLLHTFWPFGLSAFYPHWGEAIMHTRALALAALLGAVTVYALVSARRAPYVLMGWLWFLGVTFPMTGIFQGLGAAMADRYTYFSLTGVFVVLVWEAAAVAERFDWDAKALRGISAVVIAAFAGVAYVQTSHWTDTIALFTHSEAQVPPTNYIRGILGNAYLHARRPAEAQPYWEAYLELQPDAPDATYKLGVALDQQGQTERAREYYERALELDPSLTYAQEALGGLLYATGHAAEGLAHLERALENRPDEVPLLLKAGITAAAAGDAEAALQHFSRAVSLDPSSAAAHYLSGLQFERMGRLEEARAAFRRVLERDPDHEGARSRLAELGSPAV